MWNATPPQVLEHLPPGRGVPGVLAVHPRWQEPEAGRRSRRPRRHGLGPLARARASVPPAVRLGFVGHRQALCWRAVWAKSGGGLLLSSIRPPAYLKVHTASYHFLGNGKIRRFGCSLLFSGVASITHMGYSRPCEDFKVLGRLDLECVKLCSK